MVKSGLEQFEVDLNYRATDLATPFSVAGFARCLHRVASCALISVVFPATRPIHLDFETL